MRRVVVPGARAGILLGATTLATGRALGETIAVTMVIGNTDAFHPLPVRARRPTLASLIANEFTEATEPFHLAALVAVARDAAGRGGVVNLAARLLVRSVGRQGAPRGRGAMTIMAVDPVLARRAEIQRIAQATDHRRDLLSKAGLLACRACLVVVLVPLVALVAYVVIRGASAWNWAFFSHLPTPAGIPGGGIWNAIVGSLVIDAIAAAAAIPFGIVAGLFLAESDGRVAGVLRLAADVLSGVPSIVIGDLRLHAARRHGTRPLLGGGRRASPSGSSCCR